MNSMDDECTQPPAFWVHNPHADPGPVVWLRRRPGGRHERFATFHGVGPETTQCASLVVASLNSLFHPPALFWSLALNAALALVLAWVVAR